MLDTQQTNNIVKADRARRRAPGAEIEVAYLISKAVGFSRYVAKL
jgi:hypothetical protein